MSRLKTHLTLGRVSNLPTVWTNVLSAGAVAGASIPAAGWLPLLFAMTLLYVAGMYYNDACDADHDRKHQAFRPIPSGKIERYTVEAYAFFYVVVALLLLYTARMTAPWVQGSSSIGWLICALALVACIVLYDRHHKHNRYSPLVMAACRALVLLTSAYTLSGTLTPLLLLAIIAMLCWLIGLTFLAKNEHTLAASGNTWLKQSWPIGALSLPVLVGLWLSLASPAVLLPLGVLSTVVVLTATRLMKNPAQRQGSGIAVMIASISLVDGIFLAALWGVAGAILSIMAFCLTLACQRWIAGT